MRNKLFFVLFLIPGIATPSIKAQILEPVKWTVSAEPTGVINEFTLIFKGTIDEGWKVYSHYMPKADISPVPLNIFYDKMPDGLVLEGEMEELGRREEAIEPLFDNLNIKFYHKKVTLRQKVKITKDVKLEGYLEYMTCDDVKCLPPGNFNFSFDLKADKSSGYIDMGTDYSKVRNPVTWNITTEKISDTEYWLKLNATITPTWKLYSQNSPVGGARPMVINFENLKDKTYSLIGKAEEIGELETKEEPLFENKVLKYYHTSLLVKQKIRIDSPTAVVKGFIDYQTCDATQCTFGNKDFTFELANGEIREVVSEADTTSSVATLPAGFKVDFGKAANCDPTSQQMITDPENKNLWSTFLLGFIGGLIGLLMPCTFPMIPFTISFFTKRATSKKKGIFGAAFYGFSIVLVYFICSLPFLFFGASGDSLNDFSTNNVVNLVFFGVFILFALSLFGLFEIRLPNSWANKADSASNVGGLLGIFFMALTLCIVSFSCTGPILGSLLANSIKDGGVALSFGLVGFGVAFALAFTLLALFPQLLNKMPKSGGWLNEVKIVFAFVELAFSLKFLSNVDMAYHWNFFKYEIFLGCWTILAFLTFLYVSGAIRFSHDDKKVKWTIPRGAFAILFLSMTIYFAQGLTKNGTVPMLSGFLPPKWYSIYERDNECPLGLNCFHDFDEALAYANETNKPILIDFTGYACVNCRKMEEHVWPQDEVFKLINEEYVLVSLYVDDKEALRLEDQYVSSFSGSKVRTVGNKWSDFQARDFNTNSQPYYVLIAPDGTVLNEPKAYTPDVQQYTNFLQCGLDSYEALRSVSKK